MKSRLAILGSGDHGRVIYDALVCAGRADEVQCLVNFDNEREGSIDGWMGVLTYLSWRSFLDSSKSRDASFIAAFGNINRRKLVYEMALEQGLQPVSVVHPRATISIGAVVGAGTSISANCFVGVDARIGSNCILNSGAIVDHDCRIADHVNIGPGANLAGHVKVEEMSMIGLGASTLGGIQVAAASIVAAGAVVTTDVSSGVMVAGVPARFKKYIGNSP